MKHKKRP